MKTIIRKNVPEKAQYHCDVTGMPLPYGPCATITIRCGYGAPHDGCVFQLDLSEKTTATVLPLIRALLLQGGPLEPHRTEDFLSEGPLREKHITVRERAALLRQLEKLSRYKIRTLVSVRKGLVEAAAGKTVSRATFGKKTIAKQNFDPAQVNEIRRRVADIKQGQAKGVPLKNALAEARHVAGMQGARRRKRILLPEFEKMMARRPDKNVLTALSADRDDR